MLIPLLFLASAACALPVAPAPTHAAIQQPAQAQVPLAQHHDDTITLYGQRPLDELLSAVVSAVMAPSQSPLQTSAASLKAQLDSVAGLFAAAVGEPAGALLALAVTDSFLLELDSPPVDVAGVANALSAALRTWPTAASHAAFLAAVARVSAAYVDPAAAVRAADAALGPAANSVRALLEGACAQEDAEDGGVACAADVELRAAWQAVVAGPVEAQLSRHA